MLLHKKLKRRKSEVCEWVEHLNSPGTIVPSGNVSKQKFFGRMGDQLKIANHFIINKKTGLGKRMAKKRMRIFMAFTETMIPVPVTGQSENRIL